MKTKAEKTQAAIRRDIVEFLNATSGRVDPNPGPSSCGIRHRNALVLATCYGSRPRATVLEFFNEGMTIYVFGEPGGKIANIKRNPQVSAIVYEQPLDHGALQKSLQLFGRAELITVRNNPRLFWSKIRKWHMDAVGRKIMSPLFQKKNLTGADAEHYVQRGLASLSVIKIIPEHVILKQWNPDFSMQRYEWREKAS
jgi:hypothetical protein